MTKTSINYAIWSKMPFFTSNNGVELRLAMLKTQHHPLPLFISGASFSGSKSRDYSV